MAANSQFKRLMDYLDEYPEPARSVARSVLVAELGKLHLQNPRDIKTEIRGIIEKEAVKPVVEDPR